MSVPNLHVWLDDDGYHIWAAHRCTDGPSIEMLPHPKWRAVGNDITPSFHCVACGTHEFGHLDHAIPAWMLHDPKVQAMLRDRNVPCPLIRLRDPPECDCKFPQTYGHVPDCAYEQAIAKATGST